MAKESTRHRKARKQRQKRIRKFRKSNITTENQWMYYRIGDYDYKRRLNADGSYTCLKKRIPKSTFKFDLKIESYEPTSRSVLKELEKHLLDLENGQYPIKDSRLCNYAAFAGRSDILKYARSKGCSWNEYTAMYIAETMKVEDMIWAHENGCPWNERACQMAAKADNMDMIKYLHENGCPWNEWASFSCRSLKMLKYLHENGCPWNSRVMDNVALKGNVEMLSYLFDNGCPRGKYICSGM